MLQVLRTSWPLLLGVMLLMVGNGMQGTLLGLRGNVESFSTTDMAYIMSAYFLGFLGGSRLTPEMIRRVGHVRVFAALGSMISAVLILYPAVLEPWVWIALRVVIGFCFCGVYITAESWLNNGSTNENRGKALSLYMIVQMIGIIAAQGILVLGDPSGFIMFVVPSVLVSIAFAPILLSVQPTPPFGSTKTMDIGNLYRVSPLGAVGVFLMGGVFAAQFGMTAVYALEIGLTINETGLMVAMTYVGALVTLYPVGWISDRMDRRLLILIVALIGGLAGMAGLVLGEFYIALLVISFLVGGAANPLYSLLIAYTNDFLEPDDMAAASAGMLFLNGVGAVAGPIVAGLLMQAFGPSGFWLVEGVLMLALSAYAAYRMTRRRRPKGIETAPFVPVTPMSAGAAVDLAADVAVDWAHEQHDNANAEFDREAAANEGRTL